MSGVLKDVLDDVASAEVGGLRIDLAAADIRPEPRRKPLHPRSSRLLLAAAAVAAAVAVAVALPLTLLQPSPPSGQPEAQGLPDHWYFTPAFAPPVTRAWMPAASLLLAGNGGPVLVSADGGTYARLPWGPDDRLATLSADGTRVAWLTTEAGRRTVVHQLRLRDGAELSSRLDHELPDPAQVIWAGGQVYVTGEARTYRVDGRTGAVSTLCRCRPGGALGVDQDDRLVQPKGGGLPGVREVDVYRTIDSATSGPAPTDPGLIDQPTVASRPLVVSPDGRRTATVVGEDLNDDPLWYLLVTGPGDRRRSIPLGNSRSLVGVQPLAWTDAGILLVTEVRYGLDPGEPGRSTPDSSGGAGLALLRPDGTMVRNVSSRLEFIATPVAVAADLIGDGTPVKTAPPVFPAWDRDRIRYVAAQLWRSNYPYWQLGALGGILALAALLQHRRRRP